MLQKSPATLHYQRPKYWNIQEFASAINKQGHVAQKDINMGIRAPKQEKTNDNF